MLMNRPLAARDECQQHAVKHVAALIFSLFAVSASAQSSVQLFGLLSEGVADISTVHSGTSSGSLVKMQSALNAVTFIGMRGEEDLGAGNKAIFSLEQYVALPAGTAGQGTSFYNKNAYVGLGNSTLGTVMLGRNDEFAPEQCGMSGLCASTLIYSLHPGELDRVGGGSLADMIKYVSPTFHNFTGRAYYSFADASAGTNAGRAMGFEAFYNANPLSLLATYESINGASIAPLNPVTGFGTSSVFGIHMTPASTLVLNKEDIYLLNARYVVGSFTLFGDFSDVAMTYHGDNESLRTWEAGAVYQIAAPLILTAGGWHATMGSSDWNTASIALTYSLSKRTRVYVADTYQHVSGSNQSAQLFQAGLGGKSQNAIAVGITESF
jgi:outer membrane protein OmpU